MKNTKPLVSVIMPAYNAEKYIANAINSILHQTFKQFELIIINDSSTDKTLRIIRSLIEKDSRIRIINSTADRNIGRVLNKGIKLAKSDIIARMDADDIALPERLELQYSLINKSNTTAVVGINIAIIDEEGNITAVRKYPHSDKKLKSCLFRYSPFAHPGVMFRKRAFEEVGGYNPKYSPTEDLDLWFRLGSKYKFGSVPETLLKYRVYESSSSHSIIKNLEMLVFRIRLDAIMKYGYRPNLYDIVYNLFQFITLWFTSPKYRISIYNFLRNNDLI